MPMLLRVNFPKLQQTGRIDLHRLECRMIDHLLPDWNVSQLFCIAHLERACTTASS